MDKERRDTILPKESEESPANEPTKKDSAAQTLKSPDNGTEPYEKDTGATIDGRPTDKDSAKEYTTVECKTEHKRSGHHRKKRGTPRITYKYLLMQKIAAARIEYLMKKAMEIYPKNPEWAEKYKDMARRYSMAAKVKIPPQYKKFICHKCKKLMIPGFSGRFRIQSRKKRGSRLVITCLNCGHSVHIFFKGKNKKTAELPRKNLTNKQDIKEENENSIFNLGRRGIGNYSARG